LTVEQSIALIGALTALVAAVSALLVQVHMLRKDVNGRVSDLLEAAGMAREKRGELAGRDFMRRVLAGHPGTASGDVPPTGRIPG
jgi:hypothetical protein